MSRLQIQEPSPSPSPSPKSHSPSPPILALGIDLGTTHTLVALCTTEGVADVLSLSPPSPLMPSKVGVTPEGEVVVGEAARLLEETSPQSVVSSFKRLMGRSLNDPIAHNFPHPLGQHKGGELEVEVGDQTFTPGVLSSFILRSATQAAQALVGYPITQAVITVPAYFDEAARQTTRHAAERAGLKVLRLLAEPTAAALAYGLDQGLEGMYGVFDWGGGTFDFSLLKMEQGVFDVIATGGDLCLGGDDADHRIAQEHFGPETWQALTVGEKAHALKEARALKEALSTSDTAHTPDASWHLDRATFETWITPLVDRCLGWVERVLADGDVDGTHLSGILLVGGATRIPLVRRRLEARFSCPLLSHFNPDHVVALGAGLQAQALTYGAQHLLLDVTPLTLGLETLGGQVEPLIHRNTRIPVMTSQTFTTSEAGQTGIVLHVLQGESPKADGCRSLARLTVSDIPPLPAGAARVDVSFSLDADGLLTVRAQEKHTGTCQMVQVKPSYGLTPDLIYQMMESAPR